MMVIKVLLYLFALGLIIFVIQNIYRHGKFKVEDALSALGIIVTIILALSIFPNGIMNTDDIAGAWTGTLNSKDGELSMQIDLFIQPGCSVGNVCGTYSVPQLPCSGHLLLNAINGDTYEFIEKFGSGADFCDSGGHEYIRLLPSGSLSWTYEGGSTSINQYVSSAVLNRK